jgi:hypothetical protein
MSREKQIEEIAKVLDSNCEGIPDAVCQENSCSSCKARQIIGIGYRKQSGWIPVQERLPEKEGWYLVYTAPDKKHRSINKAEFCKGFEWNNFEPYWRGAGGHWGNVTHWMPLPEPPKGE